MSANVGSAMKQDLHHSGEPLESMVFSTCYCHASFVAGWSCSRQCSAIFDHHWDRQSLEVLIAGSELVASNVACCSLPDTHSNDQERADDEQ
jgi:hypothetical protein